MLTGFARPDRHATAKGRRRHLLPALVTAPLVALATVGVALVTVPAQAVEVGNVAAAVADDGARVVSETVIDERTVDLAVESPALGGVGKVRLILPANWDERPATTWPSLWLLHGANPEVEDYLSWTAFTDVEGFVADKDVLVVMPSAGGAGFFSEDYNNGNGGVDWPTFHTKELPQILTRGYRANGSNAVAGISIGGLGALKYAWENPGLFKAAASYSGLLDTQNASARLAVRVIRDREGQQFDTLWGNPWFQYDIWRANNPTAQAARLKGVSLYVSAGSPLGIGNPGVNPENLWDPIEPSARSGSETFVRAARRNGVNVTTNFNALGTHSWPYWEVELKRSYAQLAAAMGQPTEPVVAGADSAPAAPAAATSSRPALSGPGSPVCLISNNARVRERYAC